VARLLSTVFLQRLVSTTLPAIWPFFTMLVYRWNARDIGYSLAAFGVAGVIAQAGLVGRLDARLGTRATAAVGLALVALGYLGFAFGVGSWVPLVCIPLSTMGFVAGPALVSLLSRATPPDEQGAMQGAIASVGGLAAVAAPMGMPLLFSLYSVSTAAVYFPGMPFLLGAVLAALGAWMVMRAEALVVPRPA
jgi:DHA1 family tetracycline resistance protein-like MFS transporter